MRRSRIVVAVTGGFICLFVCMLASVAYGSKVISFQNVIKAIFDSNIDTFEANVVRARIPRTIFGVLAGSALGVSGALMQAITRNPIADPSILGVNTGASLFVVVGISFFHITSGTQYIWLAFLGASLTAVFVYGMASTGYGGATPIKLALAGAATSTALSSLVNTVMLPSSQVMDEFRFWQAGSISGSGWSDIALVLPYILIGFLIAVIVAPSLNAMALGDEVATGLGVNIKKIRGISALAGVLLCSSTTALAGPIGFVGLMVPHFVKLLIGPDLKKVIPISALGGSCLLLIADVIGRVLGRPGELEVGIVTAMIGAPVFILVVRKAKVRTI